MPIQHYEGNKTVIIAGTGDIVWGPGWDVPKGELPQTDKEPEYILIKQGEPGDVGRKLPDGIAEDWSVKIVLPNIESWRSLVDTLNDYAKKKWYKPVKFCDDEDIISQCGI